MKQCETCNGLGVVFQVYTVKDQTGRICVAEPVQETCRECGGTGQSRPSWDEYHLGMARAAAARADCRRAQHGAVVVRNDYTIAATGYNGHWRGGPSCLKGECPRGLVSRDECPSLSSYDTGDPAHRCESLHAESNALATLRESGEGMTLYVTGEPCPGCVRTARAHRIAKIVWPEGERQLP